MNEMLEYLSPDGLVLVHTQLFSLHTYRANKHIADLL